LQKSYAVQEQSTKDAQGKVKKFGNYIERLDEDFSVRLSGHEAFKQEIQTHSDTQTEMIQESRACQSSAFDSERSRNCTSRYAKGLCCQVAIASEGQEIWNLNVWKKTSLRCKMNTSSLSKKHRPTSMLTTKRYQI